MIQLEFLDMFPFKVSFASHNKVRAPSMIFLFFIRHVHITRHQLNIGVQSRKITK